MTTDCKRGAIVVLALVIVALATATTASAQAVHIEWLQQNTGVADKAVASWPPALSAWRTISPAFGDLYVQHNNFDIDHDGEVTDGDYILLALTGSGPIWYRVGWAGTLCYLVNPGGGFLGFEVVLPNPPGAGPVGETWRPIYPVPDSQQTVAGWSDTNLNTLLDAGDTITIGATEYAVELVGFAAVIEEGDPISIETDTWGALKQLYGAPAD